MGTNKKGILNDNLVLFSNEFWAKSSKGRKSLFSISGTLLVS